MKTPITCDHIGFPMIYVNSLDAYVHWLPLTKIQFEYYLCWSDSVKFTQADYDEMTRPNPRISPQEALANKQYWRLLASGLTVNEVHAIAKWFDSHKAAENWYGPLTQSDWTTAYDELRQRPALDVHGELLDLTHATERARLVVEAVDQARRDANQAQNVHQQMLLEGGVMEWLLKGAGERDDEWVQFGSVNRSWRGTKGLPYLPPQPPLIPREHNVRNAVSGVRLKMRPAG